MGIYKGKDISLTIDGKPIDAAVTKQEALERLKEKREELISKGDLSGAAACIAQINTVRAATAYIRESPKPSKGE